jgi:hypothetical protein
MRPALLNPLFAPITSLAGVGPKQDKPNCGFTRSSSAG